MRAENKKGHSFTSTRKF